MSKSKKQARGLGRGLSALLGDASPTVDLVPGDYMPEAGAVDQKSTSDQAGDAGGPGNRATLPVAFLERNNSQPRVHFNESALADLAASITEMGLLQPILVRPLGADQYQIVAGERRWRAAQQAGLHDVPVVIMDLDDREVLEIAVVENVQREDLTPLEEAEGYDRLMKEFGHTQSALSKIVGKSRSHVANMMRLLGLPKAVQEFVTAGSLSTGHARALIGLDNALALAKEIVDKGLSVRQAEALAASTKAPTTKKKSKAASGPPIKDADTVALEKDLAAAVGLKVSIDHQGDSGGTVTLSYQTLDQLDDICARLGVCGL